MFSDKLIIAALLGFIAAFSFGAYSGYEFAQGKNHADRAKMIAEHNAQIDKQIEIANNLSVRLNEAQGKITVKHVEVIKYVLQVTTGKPCLGPAAVSLLQPGSNTGIRPPASEPVTESTGASATDTDIAYWIADANAYYETCAERLNTLIDYVDGATKQ